MDTVQPLLAVKAPFVLLTGAAATYAFFPPQAHRQQSSRLNKQGQ